MATYKFRYMGTKHPTIAPYGTFGMSDNKSYDNYLVCIDETEWFNLKVEYEKDPSKTFYNIGSAYKYPNLIERFKEFHKKRIKSKQENTTTKLTVVPIKDSLAYEVRQRAVLLEFAKSIYTILNVPSKTKVAKAPMPTNPDTLACARAAGGGRVIDMDF